MKGALIAALWLAALPAAGAQSSADYRIAFDALDNGIGDVASASYRLRSTLGGPVGVGRGASASYRSEAGFQSQFAAVAPATLSVLKTGGGTGSITSAPAGIACGATCSFDFPQGSAVTLSAAADAGSTFASWTGCDSSNGGSCTVTMGSSRNVTASFTANSVSHLLTVAKNGTGQGTVASIAPASPSIDCGAVCSASFAQGTAITLVAVANSGSTFTGWSQCPAPSGTQCTLSIAAPVTITATFTRANPASSDFNADGKPDLIWSNTVSGSTYVWYMNGPLLVSDAFLAGIDPSWKIQGVADFNGDGQPDLVWRNTATGNTYVWYMNGTTFVSDAFLFSLPPEWVIQGVADFNGDGHPDFLMRNTNSGVAFAWFFNDATAIGDQFLFGIDPLWKVEAVADLNGDGQPDLLFRNMTSGLAFAWNTQFSAGTLSLAGSSAPIFGIDPIWEVAQMADWNGDGRPDLLFRNRNTGLVFVWYMSDLTLQGSDFVTQIDPSWEIVPRR